ncbi:MAG TPA: nicotinate (nicotinamide) nucleotide adenylyltransferase [Ferruginibacter sp.]|nr:nicotinate (nicotinamide) nucleotide adenylyltransferase [Ferruginibacter sp.]HMP19890.1 nicotinate (nicotinamide) nucleotide adenylyltransferase [Ferruginibacter sp.]
MKIGLYFGSFNPIHTGHLIIANYIAAHTALEQIWFVVSPHNPLKKSSTLLNEYHRLHLVQKAIEGENKLKASSIEFKLPKPSYTIDTLTYLEEKYPNYHFAIIMGSDSFQNIEKWKNYTELLKRYTIYIYKRPGFDVGVLTDKNIRILDAPLLEISSTAIRKLIQANKSIRYYVPDSVKEEIEKNGYYKKRN